MAQTDRPRRCNGLQTELTNYLLNSRYQLRFTAVIVGISAMLTGGLGYLVLSQGARGVARGAGARDGSHRRAGAAAGGAVRARRSHADGRCSSPSASLVAGAGRLRHRAHAQGRGAAVQGDRSTSTRSATASSASSTTCARAISWSTSSSTSRRRTTRCAQRTEEDIALLDKAIAAAGAGAGRRRAQGGQGAQRGVAEVARRAISGSFIRGAEMRTLAVVAVVAASLQRCASRSSRTRCRTRPWPRPSRARGPSTRCRCRASRRR